MKTLTQFITEGRALTEKEVMNFIKKTNPEVGKELCKDAASIILGWYENEGWMPSPSELPEDMVQMIDAADMTEERMIVRVALNPDLLDIADDELAKEEVEQRKEIIKKYKLK